VDLASQPDNSAVCIIDWSGHSADVRALACTFAGCKLDDNTLLGILEQANKAAIDAPFGWRSQVRRRKVDQMAPGETPFDRIMQGGDAVPGSEWRAFGPSVQVRIGPVCAPGQCSCG
jgi:hypothetical protein